MGGIWERQIRTARNILEELLRTHCLSLNDESLRTLMAEVELIVNLRHVTVKTYMYISPSNLLTLKSSAVMPPPGGFSPQICIPKNDGDVFNILLKNFGADREKSSFRAYNPDKNGKSKHQVHRWRYSTVKGRMSAKPMANCKNCQY